MNFIKYVVAFFMLAMLSACGGGGGNPGTPAGGSAALFTSAPASLTLTSGTTSLSYNINGGFAPYTANSDKPSLIGVSISGSTFTISAIAGTGGSGSVTVADSSGKSVIVSVIVPAPSALFSTAPATLQILNGTTNFYTVFGGTTPYVVNSNGVTARAVLSGASLAIAGLVPGNQTVAVSDAMGAVLSIDVTVKAGLYTDAPAALSVASGTGATYTIYGGVAFSGANLYKVNSSNPVVASATVNGATLAISGFSSGSTSLVISDSVGATTVITVTVPVPGAILSTAPSNLKLATGTSGTYAISGGVGPYTATSANPALVSALVSGSSLTIGAVADTVGGTASVIVSDAAGTLPLTIAVTAAPVQFFTTAPATLAIASGASKVFAVFGGSLPYSVVSTYPAIATGFVSGSTLTITGAVAGSGTVILSDAKGASVSISVLVNAPGPLYLSAPDSVVISSGGYNVYDIIGGAPPYIASSSDLSVVRASIVNSNQVNVIGLSDGSATIAVTDSAGTKVPVKVTVGTAPVPFFVNAPVSLNMGAGTATGYRVSGGTKPYTASSSDTRVVTASVDSAGALTLNALTVGKADLLIADALGAFKPITVTVDSTGGTGPTAAASIDILASGNSLNSAPGSSISFIVTVKDRVNSTLPTQTVAFAASSGTLTGANPAPVTNAAGTISSVTLSPGADASIRNITVTATTGGVTKTITIPVVGTTLAISGPGAALVGSAPQHFTVKAVDSGGKPIVGASLSIASALLNGISPATVTTDSSGAATVAFTAAVVGTDTLTVTGLGTSGTASVVVSNVDFGFAVPTAGALLPVSSANPVTVLYRVGGVGVGGQTVTFGATRGTLSATTAVTSSDPATLGQATVTVSSTTAGPVTVSAQLGTARTSLTAAFVATVPANVVLQVNPAAVLPNASGNTNQSALTAVVRDAVGNPVQGVVVNFSAVTDGSNGSIAPGSATTDANGLATAQFIPGPLSTAANGVQIRATVQSNPTITSPASLTVNGEALFISIARSGALTAFDSTTYQKEFSVYVTDANGAPAGNRAVTLSVDPISYGKGSLVWTPTLGPWDYASGSPTSCINEDTNRNGILDLGEDLNGNGKLEPGNPAVITSSVVTDALGFATFTLRYGKNYALWVKTQITARSLVGGTESKQIQSYDLEMTVDDAKAAGSPANVVSSFGIANVCTSPN